MYKRQSDDSTTSAIQLSLMNGPSDVEKELTGLDIANLTPLEAINELYRLQDLSGGTHSGFPE